MSFMEVTHLIERMPEFEERLGIRVQSLMATVEQEPQEGHYQLDIQGEIYGSKSTRLSQDVFVHLVCQNKRGQVVGTGSSIIHSDSFVGYKPFHETLYCVSMPERIKIVPSLEWL